MLLLKKKGVIIINKKTQLISGIKKATIEMILLKLLSEEDMYGYQLTQEVKKRSNGIHTILEGSMYPILYRLTDQLHVTSYEKKMGARKVRVYYHLEPSGKQYLYNLLDDYRDAINMIEFLMDSEGGDIFNG